MPASMVAEVRRRFGVPVVVRYTSTESSLGTGTTLTSSDEEVATTVGGPVAGVELAIVDDDGTPGARRIGRPGPAALRGRHARLLGPRARAGAAASRSSSTPTATAAVLAPDGWLTTGDFGRLTPEGNLQLSGRAHERYIRGGYNVYPAEVEEVLSSHPAVARVAVVGVPDDVLGEVGVAVVVAAAGAAPELDALRAHCAGDAVRLQGPRRAGRRRRAAADPDDEGRPGAARRPGGERGATERRAAPGAESSARPRGARQWPHRSRRREGARMSPTTRVGESDPNRGTAPEAITPGSLRRARGAWSPAPASGIGRATARRLAAEGAAVACLDVAEDAIDAVAARDQHGGRRGRRARHRGALRRDRRGRAWRRRWPRPTTELGPITNLCNIAGIGGFAHTPEQSLSGWDKIIAVNLTGTFLMCRAVLPGHDRARRRHREHRLDRRHHRPAVLGRVLRVQGRRASC